MSTATNKEVATQTNRLDDGFRFGTIECRYFPKRVSANPEIELVYINKGEGICFAGDTLTSFATGDLFLFSGGVSHYFKSAPQFYDANYPLRCGSTSLQFRSGTLPSDYSIMSGCENISRVISLASSGIKWSAKDVDPRIIAKIESIEMHTGLERLMSLYTILDNLGVNLDLGTTISSETPSQNSSSNDSAYRSVMEYITHNFHENITLDELAARAGMNRTALCRHFRARTNRSIFDFLLEFRITYARLQLLSTSLPISEISTAAGFNNLPNFNVQFKRLTGCTPGEYRLRGLVK